MLWWYEGGAILCLFIFAIALRQLKQQSRFLFKKVWKYCAQCKCYIHTHLLFCPSCFTPLRSIEIARLLQLYRLNKQYQHDHPIWSRVSVQRKNRVGARYLWLQDVSQRWDWEEAIWIAIQEDLSRLEDVHDFMEFYTEYEVEVKQSVTLHGALRLFFLQKHAEEETTFHS